MKKDDIMPPGSGIAPDYNIHQRIAWVMQEVSYVQKESKKVNNQYTFVSHDAVTAALRPFLVKYGIVYHPSEMKVTQDGNRCQIEFVVCFANIFKPSDCILVPTVGYGIDSQDKGPGKAMSYGVKYALLKTFGLETGDDPERDLVDHKPAKSAFVSKGGLEGGLPPRKEEKKENKTASEEQADEVWL